MRAAILLSLLLFLFPSLPHFASRHSRSQLPAPRSQLWAQQAPSLDASRRRLEEIRAERERLEAERQRLAGQVRDAGAELRNIERQRESTNRIVNELESQMQQLGSQVDQVSVELVLAEDNLADKRAVLSRRLAEIYKRGRLHTFQALLSAGSFGDLVSRYKYLALQSRQDRALVADVDQLRRRVARQRSDLLGLRSSLDQNREERAGELSRYNQLASQRQTRIGRLRRSERTTTQQLTALQRDERQLLDVIARLERARRESAARGGAPAARGTISTADLGRLDWPVEGRIVYDFGRSSLESGAEIRWNGIGIGSSAGTPVRAVSGGRVELVSRLSTYGLTVLLAHGDGYYSFYAQLATAGVEVGRTVAKGQAIGTVGGGSTDFGAHLHFEIRGPGGAALDPTNWLRRRR
jgi:septal ring factor EnvC (AmiA/AmiB activator)